MTGSAQTLPQGWSDATLDDLGEVIRGVSYKKDQVRDGAGQGLVPLLRATNIGRELSFDDVVYVPAELVRPDQHLRPNDIVIAASSGSIKVVGKAAQLLHPWEGTFGAFCVVFRPNRMVDARYVALFMASPFYRARVSSLAAGININNLKRQHILETPIPLPPREEQTRIVECVESLLAQTNDGIRSFRSAFRHTEAFESALYAHARGCPGRCGTSVAVRV